MHWNGYTSGVGCVGGSAACDGSILLQCWQFAPVVCTSFVILEQMIDASSFAIMAEVPCGQQVRERCRWASVKVG